MVMGDDGNLRPALGESWKAVPHARVLVEKQPEGSQCTATLVKHSRLVHPHLTAASCLVPVIMHLRLRVYRTVLVRAQAHHVMDLQEHKQMSNS